MVVAWLLGCLVGRWVGDVVVRWVSCRVGMQVSPTSEDQATPAPQACSCEVTSRQGTDGDCQRRSGRHLLLSQQGWRIYCCASPLLDGLHSSPSKLLQSPLAAIMLATNCFVKWVGAEQGWARTSKGSPLPSTLSRHLVVSRHTFVPALELVAMRHPSIRTTRTK